MKFLICVVLCALGVAMIGCGAPTTGNVANTNQTNTMTANVNRAEPSPTQATQTSSPGSLATPSDAYRTAHAYRENKDLAGMKRVLSKDVLEFLTMMAEADKKTLDDQIADVFTKPQAKTAESRNEKINGDRATLEYLDETGSWTTMDFIKEGPDWKMSLPDKDDVEIETGVPGKKRP